MQALKSYIAWMCFWIAGVNILSTGIKHASGNASVFVDWPHGTISALLALVVLPFFLFVWWRWK